MLNGLADRPVVLHAERLLQPRKQLVDEIERRLNNSIVRLFHHREQRLQELARATEALSPLGVLSRGYSLTRLEGAQTPLRTFREVSPGQRLATRLAEGVVISRIESVNDNPVEEVW